MRGVYISRGAATGGLLRWHAATENDEGSLSRAWTVVRRHNKYKVRVSGPQRSSDAHTCHVPACACTGLG